MILKNTKARQLHGGKRVSQVCMGLPLTPQMFNSEFTPEKWWLEDVCLSYRVSVTFQRLCSTSGGEMIVLFFCFFLSSSFFPRKFLCVSINDDRPLNSCCKGIKDIVDQTVRQLQKELKVAGASQLGKGKLIVFFCFNPSVQSARNMKRSKIEG